MANKTKTVSINEFEKMLLDNEPAEHECNGIKFTIKHFLTLQEMLDLVSFVVASCVDDTTGDYTPESYNFALRKKVIEYYTNLKFPSDLNKQYKLVYETSVYSTVMHYADEDQLTEIITTIQNKIDFMLDMITSSAVSKVGDIIEKFSNITEATDKIFSGLNSEEMGKVISAVSNMEQLSDESIAKVLIDTLK